MPDDTESPQDADLEREIAAALEGRSVLDIARQELMPPTPAGPSPDDAPAEGRFREGTVAGVGEEDVFLEFGVREQGVVPKDHFATPPEVGESVRVFVQSYDAKENLYLCSVKRTAQTADWDALDVGAVLVGLVRAVNPGGLDVQTGLLTAFLPASHASLEHVEDLETFVGQRFEVEVIEVDRDRRRLVVSRRGILGREREARRSEALGSLKVDSIVPGKVTKIEPFGAFVDIGGVEGLLHVSEMAWKRVEKPEDHVAVGDDLKVQILKIEEDGKRISLSIKVLQEDPWLRAVQEHPEGSVLEGTVTRVASFGAFVEIADGVEGLAHISQLAPHPVDTVKEVVRPGQKIPVRIMNVEPDRRRIGLSLLSERGDRLTDDVADDDTIRAVLGRGREEDDVPEPTLGDLLKKALEEAGDD